LKLELWDEHQTVDALVVITWSHVGADTASAANSDKFADAAINEAAGKCAAPAPDRPLWGNSAATATAASIAYAARLCVTGTY